MTRKAEFLANARSGVVHRISAVRRVRGVRSSIYSTACGLESSAAPLCLTNVRHAARAERCRLCFPSH